LRAKLGGGLECLGWEFVLVQSLNKKAQPPLLPRGLIASSPIIQYVLEPMLDNIPGIASGLIAFKVPACRHERASTGGLEFASDQG
jgi:hypothetical protein